MNQSHYARTVLNDETGWGGSVVDEEKLGGFDEWIVEPYWVQNKAIRHRQQENGWGHRASWCNIRFCRGRGLDGSNDENAPCIDCPKNGPADGIDHLVVRWRLPLRFVNWSGAGCGVRVFDKGKGRDLEGFCFPPSPVKGKITAMCHMNDTNHNIESEGWNWAVFQRGWVDRR